MNMVKKSSKKQAPQKIKKAKVVEGEIVESPATTRPVPIKTEEKEKKRVEGIKKTIIPGVIGVIAGAVFFILIGDGAGHKSIWFTILFVLLVFSYYIQRLIYPAVGINAREFGKKDWFYVEFIVLDFFLVSWTLLLNL
jgi:hypothetical protein